MNKIIIEDESIFMCPITHNYLQDPVMADDGYIYERNAIKKWLKQSLTSPITRLPMTSVLYINIIFNNLLKEFYKNNPDCYKINVNDFMKMINDNVDIVFYEKYSIETYYKLINEIINEYNFYGDDIYRKVVDKSNLIFNNEIFLNYIFKNVENVNNIKFRNNQTLMHLICGFSKFDIFKKIINIEGINLETESDNKLRPIHYVCADNYNLKGEDQINAIKLLMEKGINLEAEDIQQWRPIHFICSNQTNLKGEDQLNAIKLLIEKGINLEAEDNNKRRPIHYVCSLITNLKEKYQYTAIKLLVERGVELETEDIHKQRPIHFVCSNFTLKKEHQINSIKLLIDKGVNLEVKDCLGITAMDYILSNNDLKNIEIK